MATASTIDRSTPPPEPLDSPSRETVDEPSSGARPVLVEERIVAFLGKLLVRLSFWSAVFLPILYVPLLLSGDGASQELVLGLIGAHITALVGGRSYGEIRRQ